jgi:hypothetical protein
MNDGSCIQRMKPLDLRDARLSERRVLAGRWMH